MYVRQALGENHMAAMHQLDSRMAQERDALQLAASASCVAAAGQAQEASAAAAAAAQEASSAASGQELSAAREQAASAAAELESMRLQFRQYQVHAPPHEGN